MYGVTIAELIEKMKMKNLTPEIDVENAVVSHPAVNRPVPAFHCESGFHQISILKNIV